MKQGGGLSDKLFTLCYDEIIDICQSLGASVGVFHHAKIAILVYADDIFLLAFSIYVVIKLYKAVWKWASFDICFNESKSNLTVMDYASWKVLRAASSYMYETMSIFDICIPFHTKRDFKYLGVFID